MLLSAFQANRKVYELDIFEIVGNAYIPTYPHEELLNFHYNFPIFSSRNDPTESNWGQGMKANDAMG